MEPVGITGFQRRLNKFTIRLKEYVAHYHSGRNHQGLDNQLIEPGEEVGSIAGKIECRKRLGGLLKYYYRDAA
ncbi:hypothetical protein Pla110_43440 [Polystyrenella longa]|uniref:Integrase catalytic domain-containing protein n=1 Tax=Polystyrenella longa TaxID=2528007 RepID=A0A518CTS0_9PLAN|nr:hypothetical protein [Polystyrenella longa]QDU82584.1 hypothetical protein Pla110_43440 [Polystyrenella longa]